MPTYQVSSGKIYDSWFQAKWASNLVNQYLVQHIYRISGYDFTLRRYQKSTSNGVISSVRVSPETIVNCRRIIQPAHSPSSVGDVWVGNTTLVGGGEVSFLFSSDFAKHHLTSKNVHKEGNYVLCNDQETQNAELLDNNKNGRLLMFIKVPNESNSPDYVWTPYEESRLTQL